MQIKRPIWSFLFVAISMVTLDSMALACAAPSLIELNDVKFANIVVIGTIIDYKIVKNEKFRRQMLKSKYLSAEDRRIYAGSELLRTDFARFKIVVSQVLFGTAPKTLSVSWDYPESLDIPKRMANRPLLIALHWRYNDVFFRQGGSYSTLSDRDPKLVTILQAPCAGPFIFDSVGSDARAIKVILANRKK